MIESWRPIRRRGWTWKAGQAEVGEKPDYTRPPPPLPPPEPRQVFSPDRERLREARRHRLERLARRVLHRPGQRMPSPLPARQRGDEVEHGLRPRLALARTAFPRSRSPSSPRGRPRCSAEGRAGEGVVERVDVRAVRFDQHQHVAGIDRLDVHDGERIGVLMPTLDDGGSPRAMRQNTQSGSWSAGSAPHEVLLGPDVRHRIVTSVTASQRRVSRMVRTQQDGHRPCSSTSSPASKTARKTRNLHRRPRQQRDRDPRAQKLRYRVFAEEMGPAAHTQSGRRPDLYDPFWEHLIIARRDAGRIVGTYRRRRPPPHAGWAATTRERIRTSPACSTCAVAGGDRALVHRRRLPQRRGDRAADRSAARGHMSQENGADLDRLRLGEHGRWRARRISRIIACAKTPPRWEYRLPGARCRCERPAHRLDAEAPPLIGYRARGAWVCGRRHGTDFVGPGHPDAIGAWMGATPGTLGTQD